MNVTERSPANSVDDILPLIAEQNNEDEVILFLEKVIKAIQIAKSHNNGILSESQWNRVFSKFYTPETVRNHIFREIIEITQEIWNIGLREKFMPDPSAVDERLAIYEKNARWQKKTIKFLLLLTIDQEKIFWRLMKTAFINCFLHQKLKAGVKCEVMACKALLCYGRVKLATPQEDVREESDLFFLLKGTEQEIRVQIKSRAHQDEFKIKICKWRFNYLWIEVPCLYGKTKEELFEDFAQKFEPLISQIKKLLKNKRKTG